MLNETSARTAVRGGWSRLRAPCLLRRRGFGLILKAGSLQRFIGERRVNQGGEPSHDDYGLPRVDVQIPDDARELYRDVQAYHRELRAIRRHERSRRWRSPLRRTGLLLPVIAGCLILAMMASMALTMFSANPNFSGIAGQDPGSPHARNTAGGARSTRPAGRSPAASHKPGSSSAARRTGNATAVPNQTAGVPLPAGSITVAGKPVMLSRLRSAALAIVPARCGCTAVIRQLAAQAKGAGVMVYLVGPPSTRAELDGLAAGGTTGGTVVAVDPDNVLVATYRPVGLTVLLVDDRGSVTVASGLRPGLTWGASLRSLRGQG